MNGDSATICEQDVGSRLLRWFGQAQRPLPWRTDATAYSVWVSEIMLQQTRVDTVVPRYGEFLTLFPTLEALADAPAEDVLAAWSGLGYYRRARSLHEGTKVVLAKHDGAFPRTVDEALALPGVGLYTAGAILSIAYNLPVPAVDGNVERVVTRLLRLKENPKKSTVARQLRDTVRSWIPTNKAASFNQALMELGATVCTPRNPDCTHCPLRKLCAAHEHGDSERYPKAPSPQKTVPIELHAAVIAHGDRFLLKQIKGDFLDGMWLFPFADSRKALASMLQSELKGSCKPGRPLGKVRHAITFRRITLTAYACEGRPASPRGSWQWVRRQDLGKRIPVSSLAFKIAALVEEGSPRTSPERS